MNFFYIVLFLFFVLLFFVFVYYFLSIITNKKSKISFNIPEFWQVTSQNSCLLYSFENEREVTLNKEVLSNLQGITPSSCYYPNQIVAQETKITCNATLNNFPIIGFEGCGVNIPPGYQTNIYTQCSTYVPCNGRMNSISLNNNAPYFPQFCINNSLKMEICSSITNFFIEPDNNSFNILNLETMEYITVSKQTNTNTIINSPIRTEGDVFIGPLCEAKNTTINGNKLTYIKKKPPIGLWYYVNPISYCNNITCPSNVTQDCTQNTCTTDTLTLGQFIFVGDIKDFSSSPLITNGSYRGLIGGSAQIQWLIDNQVKSLFYGGNNKTNVPILVPYNYNNSKCVDKHYNSLYV